MGEGGARQTDTAGAVVVDDEGSTGSGSAPATVVLSDVAPNVDVGLAVTPPLRPEPGGTFTYTVTVDNLSNAEAVTITALASDVHG